MDEVASTEDDPHLVKEHILVISDDPVQDYDSVHKMCELIVNYLTNDLHYNTKMIHEFTDGCAAQYEYRHCIGDLSCSLADFWLHHPEKLLRDLTCQGRAGCSRFSCEAETGPSCP